MGRSEAAREPHVRRQPGFLSITMAADDDGSRTADLKRKDGAFGLEVVIGNLFQRNGMVHARNFGMDFPIARIKPHPINDSVSKTTFMKLFCKLIHGFPQTFPEVLFKTPDRAIDNAGSSKSGDFEKNFRME